MRALEGIRVIDMSHVMAGPMASFYLATMGADVIKVERTKGGDVLRYTNNGKQSTDFVSLNAGKRSIALDIQDPEALQILKDLILSADVFIENFTPGTLVKFGLDYEALVKIKPDLVYCSISGFGQTGKWSKRGGYDAVVQSLTGLNMTQGEGADAPPVKIGFPVVDVATGMLAAMSILGAVLQKKVHGKGERIDASLVQSALTLMYPLVNNYLSDKKPVKRMGNRGYSGSPTASVFKCADGWISLAANTPPQFRKTADLVGLSHLYNDPELFDLELFNSPGAGFVISRNYDAVQEAFNQAFSEWSSYELEEKLNAVGVPAARVRTVEEFLDLARDNGDFDLPFTELGSDDHTVLTAGPGFKTSSPPSADRPGTPAIGQDTRRILADLGYDAQAIDALEKRGAVRGNG